MLLVGAQLLLPQASPSPVAVVPQGGSCRVISYLDKRDYTCTEIMCGGRVVQKICDPPPTK